MLSLFYSKKKLLQEVLDLKKIKDNQTWLAIEFNNEPKYGQIGQKISYTHNNDQYGVQHILKDNASDTTISKNRIVKALGLDSAEAHKITSDINQFKSTLITHQINATLASMKELSPEAVSMEEKAWEWFRVSMDVLINAISKIDNVETILQYRLFWGIKDDVMTTRLLAYNLDIQINILPTGLLLTVYNFKDSTDRSIKDREPDQRVLVKGVYNDFFNKYIEVLKAIKSIEDKL